MPDPALSFPQINGVYYDFSSIEIAIPTVGFRLDSGFKSIQYDQKLDPGKVHGNGTAQKIGRTRGQYDPSASIEMFLPQWFSLRAALARIAPIGGTSVAALTNFPGVQEIVAPATPLIGAAASAIPGNNKGYMEAVFNISASYSEAGQLHTDELVGLRITGVSRSHQAGNEPLSVKLDLDPMMIIEDGIAPISKIRR